MTSPHESLESAIAGGALLAGLLVCLAVAWRLNRAVRRGKKGRIAATAIQGLSTLFLGMVPILVANVVTWLATLGGVALFTRDGGNDGVLVGVGIMGIILAMGVAVLFAVVMLFQAVTGSGVDEA